MSMVPVLSRPGVYIDLSSLPTYVSQTPGTAVACFVGWCPRGPTTPTVVNSWKQFTQFFGGFELVYSPSNLHLGVFSYFSAGGSSAVIIRVMHTADAAVAGLVFDDTDPDGVNPTLEIQAKNPGAWGDNLWIDILPGTLTDPTQVPPAVMTFTIQVKYMGSAQGNVVETWSNLSMAQGSTNQGENNYAPDVVNSPYNGSSFITLTDKLSTAAPPANNPALTPAGSTGQPQSQQLTGGADGSALQAADWQAAVSLLDQYPDQPFLLNLPGVSSDTVTMSYVLSYAEGRGDVFIIHDPPPGILPSGTGGMASFAQSLPYASAQVAIYYPQVLIADPYSVTPGRTRLIPPGGFVAGCYISTDMSRGVAKAPAGLGANLVGAVGLERTLTNSDQGTLTQANVNCLISLPGSGVVIWGARTLSPFLVTRYVSVERTIIYLATQLIALTKFAVFEPNDWVLWNHITSVVSQFLNSFWQSGGMSGESASDAFFVTCNDSVNTPSTVQQGIVYCEVGVALQVPAEFVVIQIGQWAGGSSSLVTTS